jgi:hypothetical protein
MLFPFLIYSECYKTYLKRKETNVIVNSKKGLCFLVLGISLGGKVAKGSNRMFGFRLRVGDWEVELSGTRDEVLKTVEELPSLVAGILKAFENVRPKAVATLTVKKEKTKAKEEVVMQRYPKIMQVKKCDEAVLRVLESDWGKWRPRTVSELKEALKANKIRFSGRVLAGVLSGLVRRGKVRRWKTDAGYVYILAEKEALA